MPPSRRRIQLFIFPASTAGLKTETELSYAHSGKESCSSKTIGDDTLNVDVGVGAGRPKFDEDEFA